MPKPKHASPDRRPSCNLVAPLPAPPNIVKQRIKPNETFSQLRLFMEIQPFDDSYGGVKEVATRIGDPLNYQLFDANLHHNFEQPYDWRRHFGDFNPKRAQEMKYGMTIGGLLYKQKLNIADFSPIDAPYVPDLISVLVNYIESHCLSSGSWKCIVEEWPQYHKEAVDLIGHLIFVYNKKSFLRRVLVGLSPFLHIEILRTFLAGFNLKSLHLFKSNVEEIVKRPLYDQFIRPNPGLRSIVQHAILPYSRTTIDTTAFLMIHLQHCLLMLPNPGADRSHLTKIYGPLVISFSERPVAVNKTSTFDSEEASLLEAIMEVCDFDFWNHIGMLKIRNAFENIVEYEKIFYKGKALRIFALSRETNAKETTPMDIAITDFISFDVWDQGLFKQPEPKIPRSRVTRQKFLLDAKNRSKDRAYGTEKMRKMLAFVTPEESIRNGTDSSPNRKREPLQKDKSVFYDPSRGCGEFRLNEDENIDAADKTEKNARSLRITSNDVIYSRLKDLTITQKIEKTVKAPARPFSLLSMREFGVTP